MPTTCDSLEIYCYYYHGLFWIGWIKSLKLERPTLYYDDTPTAIMYPASWLDYVTFGFSQGSVMKKLRKHYEKLLIPINMRDGCIVGVGKGNPDWNCSAPHGAGRIMSRMKAKEVLSLDAFRESMSGIFTTSVSAETLDEAPMVYKPMDEIVENIKDTVDILEIIKPVYNFKASEV